MADLGKASNASNVGLFVIAAVTLVFQISDRLPTGSGGQTGVKTWIIPSILSAALLIAATLHVVAAIIANRRKHDASQNNSTGQSEIDKALIQSRTRIGELERELTKLQTRDDEYKSVIELAEQQKADITAWVYCNADSLGSHDLLGRSPYIDFWFKIHNDSVYPLSIGSLDGVISFASIPVSGTVKWIKQLPDLVHPGTGRPGLESDCVVRFNFAEQSDIAPILNTVSGFGFEGLRASVLSKETDLGIRTLPFKGGLNNQPLIEHNEYKRLEIQIVNYQLWPLFEWMPSAVNPGHSFPAEAIGSVVNVRVKPRNPRDSVVEIVSIKLDSPVTGKIQRTTAARGAIFETPRSGATDPPYQGSELRPNLNECPLQFESGPHQDGWLQFIVLDEGLEGRTVTLSFIDTFGVEHKQSFGPLVVSKL